MALELYTQSVPLVPLVGALAERAEQAGWAGLAVVDSQNLAGDAYVGLGLAAVRTRRLGLATAVTNPVTRHPAASAAAIASVQALSGGRATLGIGRGDSSLAHLGRAPASLAHLEHYLEVLQGYLRGEPVAFERLGFHEQVAPDVSALGLAEAPQASRLSWLPRELPKVPVEVAATGPRAIAVAARHADRIMFALGADPERLRWGIETTRAARREAGLDPEGIAFGAYVNAVSHPDRQVARELVRGGLSTFARFAVMHGRVSGPLPESERRLLGELHRVYDMTVHTRVGSPQAELLTPEFVDRHAIVGPPEHCIERLSRLAELGLTRAIVIGPTLGADPAQARRAQALFAEAVLPAFAS